MRQFLALVALLPLVLGLAAPTRAEMTEEQKREVERVVRDYIRTNPEIVEKALMALEEQRRQQAAAQQSKAVGELADKIFRSPHQAVIGNPEGKVTLVEFFDYNCAYCKRAMADMQALLKANPDLRMVMKEFPILSQESVDAARLSVAVKDVAPERYLEFHEELLGRPGQADRDKALQVARDLGLDVAALEEAARQPSVDENLLEAQGLARALNISGTPSYVIGGEVVPGAVGFDALQDKVAAARQACAEQATC